MKVTYFVNTMVLLEGRSTRVLCDPWVTFDNVSVSDFYNFPEPRLTRDDVAAIRPDYIYLTHSHPDHFDAVTLALFDKRTPIVIARFANPFFEKAISRLGLSDIRTADPDYGLPLNGGDHCWISPSDVYPDVDSIAVLEIDGLTVLNANDNPFHLAQCRRLHERFGPVDVALLPFAAHGPYPMFYDNLSDDEKERKASVRETRSYEAFTHYISTLGARNVIPFAAGLVAGGSKALRYKYSGIGTRRKAVAYAQRSAEFNAILLSEGCCFDVALQQQEGAYVEVTHANQHAYLERIAKKPTRFDAGGRFHVAPSEQIDLSPYLAIAREKQRKWQEIKNTTSDAAYFLDCGQDQLYRLCLADAAVTRVREAEIADSKYEIFRMPYGLLLGLLTRHYNWSNVKTQYITYYRQPDMFDPQLHLMMSFLHI